jgi:hypothetical protein
MTRVFAWIAANVDALLAPVLALCVLVIGLIDVDLVGPDQLQNALLVVLATVSVSMLRDRSRMGAVERQLDGIGTTVASTRKSIDEGAMVRVLSGDEVGQALAEARTGTDQWIFKGGTGTYIRAVTLPDCVRSARQQRRPLTIRLEIIDPTNDDACGRYARFRHSVSDGPDGTGELWTLDRTRKESYATVLSACWYKQRFELLDIVVGMRPTMTTFRWDLSSRYVVITQEDPAAPAMVIERGRAHYERYATELRSSLEQTRRLPIQLAAEAVPLNEEPTVEETKKLFDTVTLPLPASFTERDVRDVITKAVRAKNPYQS